MSVDDDAFCTIVSFFLAEASPPGSPARDNKYVFNRASEITEALLPRPDLRRLSLMVRNYAPTLICN